MRSELGRVYRNFDLTVNLGQLRTIQVFCDRLCAPAGQLHDQLAEHAAECAVRIGRRPLPQGTLRDIQVLRGNRARSRIFDLYDLLLRGDKSKDVQLQPGDVIFISGRGSAGGGDRKRRQSGYLRRSSSRARDTTVTEVLALAGGKTSVALGSQVRIERIFEHTLRSIVDVDLAKAGTTDVFNGDIVTVATISRPL